MGKKGGAPFKRSLVGMLFYQLLHGTTAETRGFHDSQASLSGDRHSLGAGAIIAASFY